MPLPNLIKIAPLDKLVRTEGEVTLESALSIDVLAIIRGKYFWHLCLSVFICG